MSIVTLLVVLLIVGVGLYLLNSLVPLPRPIKMVINIVVVVAVLVWLLSVFGLIGDLRVGRLR